MSRDAVIDIKQLVVSFGRSEALRGLDFRVERGRCHALFGRNGAGKTTTLKALLGLVPIAEGSVRLFGLDPQSAEREVKRRLAWVPDAPGFYPWMRVCDALDYVKSVRPGWRPEIARALLERFELDPSAQANDLSKGQRTQLALTGALACDPELLVLDEPTSGLDPIVRRQFVDAIISTFQERDPENKTLLVSTHLINEFEGVVDDFTLIDRGRNVLTLDADAARSSHRRIRAWFADAAPSTTLTFATLGAPRREGRMLEVLVGDAPDEARRALTALGAERIEAAALSLEEIFLAAAARARGTEHV